MTHATRDCVTQPETQCNAVVGTAEATTVERAATGRPIVRQDNRCAGVSTSYALSPFCETPIYHKGDSACGDEEEEAGCEKDGSDAM